MAYTSNEIKLFPCSKAPGPLRSRLSGPEATEKSKQFSILQLEGSSLDRCLEILEWRLKTFLPVVKPLHFALDPPRPLSPLKQHQLANRSPQHFQKTSQNPQGIARRGADSGERGQPGAICEVVVEMEEIRFLLSGIKLLPFPQVVYLLKEMMIGYEVLVDIFGIFEPSDAMVAVSGSGQWRLWVNANFTLNAEPAPNISEKEFIYKLILMAEAHCLQTTLSKRFFLEVKEITYSQECSFVKVLQKTKDFATANKVYTANVVMLPREEKQEGKTLKKQKGFHRIEQLKSSLIDGRFVPKETWAFRTEINDPSVCSIGEVSPARRVESMRSNDGHHREDIKNEHLIVGWKTHNQLYEFYTPRQKCNVNAGHLYSPQIFGESQSSPIRPNRSTVSPLLNFTTSNSIIERRRRSDQVKGSNKLQANNNEEKDFMECRLKRQPAARNLNEKIKKEGETEDLMNSFNKSSSTEFKQSEADNPIAYKNLKRNDFQVCKPRNNQSGFVNIIPTYQRNQNKNLSISYEFKTGNEQKEKEQEGSDPPVSRQWKNTISGLFSDTATIRQLKTSIKIKTPNQKKEERRYASDINLEVLSKMGRDASDSFDEEDEQDRQEIDEIAELKLTEQSVLWRNPSICKDQQEDEVLRKPSCASNIPRITISSPGRQKKTMPVCDV